MKTIGALRKRAAQILFALAMFSCDDNLGNPSVLREAPDGARWEWDCEHEQCVATPTEEIESYPECDADEELGVMWVWGRFFKFCLGCRDPGGPTLTMTHFCRPLVCERDDDCPQFEGSRFECVDTLCQSTDEQEWPRDPLVQYDAYTICFAAYRRSETGGWWDPTAEEVYTAVEAACPGDWDAECTGALPEFCWVP